MYKYGHGACHKRLSESEFDKVWKSLINLNKDDLMMHTMKVILLLGLCYGLRGGKEICELNVSDITIGSFPDSHPLAGSDFVEVNPVNEEGQIVHL